MTVLTFLTPVPSVPSAAYLEFIDDCKAFVESKGLSWEQEFGPELGVVSADKAWDLRRLTGSHERNACLLTNFSVDLRAQNAALMLGRNPANVPLPGCLPRETQDFMKAFIAHRCREGYSSKGSIQLGRTLRKLFSTTSATPWELSSENLDFFWVADGRKRKTASDVAAISHTLNSHLLSAGCPLLFEHGVPSKAEIFEETLNDRTAAEKLPDPDVLWETVRIVFQERPVGHQDEVRFAILRLILLTGLRVNEVLMLPADCVVREEHIDVVTGRPAGEVGGTSTSLGLRYFAEKHILFEPDRLVEEVHWVPQRFQKEVLGAVRMATEATNSLRDVLARQHGQPALGAASDLREFKTVEGRSLTTADLLFLVIRGAHAKESLPIRINPRESIAPASIQGLYDALGVARKGHGTIFTRYSKRPDASQMALKPHSLRHLMNTEFFRLNVPDTIITHQFGRKSVAQSYEYDHRSLSERLRFVELPESATSVLEPDSAQEMVARMVVAGHAPESHIAKSFKAIQKAQGDLAAFRYLAASADGFHVTPYGYCTNSFSLNPCTRHLKCFDGCRHFTPSGLQEHRIKLETLVDQLKAMRESAASRPAKSIGRRNQIAHAEKLLAGARAALDSPVGVALFPDGVDHSAPKPDLFE